MESEYNKSFTDGRRSNVNKLYYSLTYSFTRIGLTHFSICFIDGALSTNNPRFGDFRHRICPKEFDTKSASYPDLLSQIDGKGKLITKLYDKCNDCSFRIINFPFICSNTPISCSLKCVTIFPV